MTQEKECQHEICTPIEFGMECQSCGELIE